MPKDNDPVAGEGSTTQAADLDRVTAGVPVLAERADDFFAVVPFCSTE
ncbi:MAG: hypothetical protein WKG06_26200 [Segetibacter sp.]